MSSIDLLNRSSVLGDLGRYEEALIALRQAEGLTAENAVLTGHLRRVKWSVLARYGSECGALGEADRSYRLLDEASRLVPDDLPTAMSRVFALTYLPDVSPERIRAEAEQFGRLAVRLAGAPREHARPSQPRERLRIGFVSADLRRHPVARFLAPLGGLDQRRFELFAYSGTLKQDDFTERFRRILPNWHEIGSMSDAAVVDQIVADGIDVLVDLSGFSAGGRMGVFARKPAPVQVTWLGYVATTGMIGMDYVLASHAVLPPADEMHWTEKPWRLPATYLAFAPPANGPAVRQSPALRNGYFTFGSFSNARKITRETLELWAEILLRVPNSRLELRSSLRRVSPESESAIREVFYERGISSERVRLSAAIQDYDQHLASYNLVDIALDTYPFAGATTSCEALWMGVPVVTRAGDRYVSRMGESIMLAIGRPEWIAADGPGYVDRAVAMAGDVVTLNAERMALRQRFLSSSVGDLDEFARSLETAFQEMWSVWYGHK